MQCPEEAWLFPGTTLIRELKRYNRGKLSASSRRPRASGGTFCFQKCQVARRSHFERWPEGPRNTLCPSSCLYGPPELNLHHERLDEGISGSHRLPEHTDEE